MWKEKEEEDEETKLTEPSEGKKKKKGEWVKSCDWWVPWCMFNYGNVIENKVIEIENT